MDLVEARLNDMGLSLPKRRESSIANIERAAMTGNLLFVSGHGPYSVAGPAQGRVGRDFTVDEGYELAKLCALGCLASAKAALGSLERIRRVVKVLGFINGTPELDQQSKVANGASDLLVALLGEEGKHARSAIGVAALPNNIPVEVEMIFEIE